MERLAASGRHIPAMLSLGVALEQSRADQTLNTPALATLFLLVSQLDWLNEQGGLAWAVKRCDESAGIVYGWAEASGYATPFVTDPAMRSHTVATVDLDPRSRRPPCRGRCGPTGSSTPSPTASWAATSSASPCSRRSSRPTWNG